MKKALIVFLVAILGVLALGVGAASAYSAGQFCKTADLGKVITASNGRLIICKRDAHGTPRWTYYTAPAPAPVAPTYTARYTAEQYGFVVRAAAFYHLPVNNVPETGVHVLAFLLKLGPHADQRPQSKPANNGPNVIATKYSTAEMQADMASTSHYIALNGNDTLYVGGLLMGYLAAIGGTSCTPGYSPCIPPGPDVDCAGGGGNGPRYVKGPVYVTGPDIYGLDADHDGIGCE